MTTLVYLDGTYLSEQEARIPASDHAFLYGRGLFESVRTYAGVPFRLDAHWARLSAGARSLDIPLRRSLEDIRAAIRELTVRSKLPDAYVRLTVTPEHVLITAQPLTRYPENLYVDGVKAVIYPFPTFTRGRLSGLKTLNYLAHFEARSYASERGAVDAIIINEHGRVVEGSASNVFAVTKDRVVTPPLTEGGLAGVTRDVLLEVLREQAIPFSEQPISTDDLKRSDEIFFTGSLKEVLPIADIDGRPVGRDRAFPWAGKIRALYRRKVELECKANPA